jgi:hypothetical protein
MNCQGLNDLEGLQFLPTNSMKQPIVKNWQACTEKHDLSDVEGVGLVCGPPSGNVECIDIDLKYSLDKKLFDKYKKIIHNSNETLLSKLVVQKTRSGGYHLIYRCSEISGNIKLARRYTTEDERADTYKRTYDGEILKSTDDSKAKTIAEKAALNDKVRVLFETRGKGGQFVCHPSPGYEFVFGDLCSITEISPEERDILHGVARQFNEVIEQYSAPKYKVERTKGLSTFDDYNKRGPVVELLESHGWKIVGQKGPKTIFLRPGQTTSQSSGNFDSDKNWFSVFTTSSEFEPEKAYLPYAVFAVLECNKNFSEASKKLFELGYGEREEKKVVESTRVIKSRVNSEDEDFSFLATPSDYDGYLQSVIDGTLVQGLSTGSPKIDEYFLFKEGNLVMVNGHDNAGKSVVIWWLALISAMMHGWNWIIFSSENTLGSFMRKMIQFYWGKTLSGIHAMSQEEYKIAKDFIESHFSLIKSEEEMYNYKDIINMVKKAAKRKKYHCGLIDPYNSLKIDLSGFSKLSTHEYHYEALSDLKQFGRKTGIGLYINNHAVTAALRAKDGEKKYPIAPQKADTEGGGKFANKGDEFLTVHRVTQHPTEWMVTELHVRKIKDTDTGGRVSPFDDPIKLEMYKNGCAFVEWLGENSRGIDPIAEWHRKNGIILPNTTTLKVAYKQQSWTPYRDENGEEVNF